MKQIIRELYYAIGYKDFSTRYHLIVTKETEKMLYGTVHDDDNAQYCGKFAINKSNLSKVHKTYDKKYGVIYRIQILDDGVIDVEKTAKEIIYNDLIKMADRLMGN